MVSKMTDNEIKKVKELIEKLKKASNSYHYAGGGLPYDIGMTLNASALWLEDCLDLTNRLQAENERLSKITRPLIAEIKAEAFTEFVEWLKEIAYHNDAGDYIIFDVEVDKLLKEKIGNDMGRYDPYTDSFVKEEMVGEDNDKR